MKLIMFITLITITLIECNGSIETTVKNVYSALDNADNAQPDPLFVRQCSKAFDANSDSNIWATVTKWS